MTAEEFGERKSTEKWLLRALVISLLIHVVAFSTWKVGDRLHWWTNFHPPRWLTLSQKLLTPQIKPAPPKPKPKPQEPVQLTFVDVDPAQAQTAPPKKPKFYSNNNTVAANPTPKNLPVPEILGRQNKVVKTTPNEKLHPQPLQPSPPKPAVVSEPVKAPAVPKSYVPGDLTMAKPMPKPAPKETTETPPVETMQKPEPAQPARPRTITEAMARKGMLGEKSHQDGGVGRISMESTLDTTKTSYGDYDREFIDAVRNRWYQLLEGRSIEGTGKVVVQFRLHPDGRITDLSMPENQMTDLLGLLCQRAILDPAPYRKWPEEMRRDIPADFRDISFTFYYSD